MTPSDIQRRVDVTDVITGMRFGLAFGDKGRACSIKKQASKCRQIMERIPAATGYRPRPDGVISLSPERRVMEQRWRELSFIVQGACARCPLRAQRRCRGAEFA